MSKTDPGDVVAAGLDGLSEGLRRDLPERWRRFVAAAPEAAAAVCADAGFARSVPAVWAASEFVAEHCLRGAEELPGLAVAVQRRWTPGELLAATPDRKSVV